MTSRVAELLAFKGGDIVATSPTHSVMEAVRTMNQHGIGSLPVLDQSRLVGIFTERDVLVRVVEAGGDPAVIDRPDMLPLPRERIGIPSLASGIVEKIDCVDVGSGLVAHDLDEQTRQGLRRQLDHAGYGSEAEVDLLLGEGLLAEPGQLLLALG